MNQSYLNNRVNWNLITLLTSSPFKMMHHVMLLVVVQVSVTQSASLRFPLLQPLQGTLQQQQLALQEQMLAIQQFQALQRLSGVPPVLAMNPQQPLLLLLPNTPSNTEPEETYTKLNDNLLKGNEPVQEIDDDSDSITIESDPQNDANDKIVNAKTSQMKAILLVPNNARFSIGDFISGIPFLPFEVNVPDSIAWIYNGISGVISGIGQSWPFSRPGSDENQSGMKVKSIWSDLKMRPIVIMPLGQPMMPFQL